MVPRVRSDPKLRSKITNMSLGQFKTPAELDFANPQWDEWKQRFETYRLITELSRKTQKIQVATLKYCMGPQSENIMKTFNLTSTESENYDNVMEKFDNYFKPRRNEIRLRKNFHQRSQRADETLEQYITALHTLAEPCKFSDPKERIRDQFFAGLKDDELSQKLELLYFTKPDDFTMDTITEYCRTYANVKRSDPDKEDLQINQAKSANFVPRSRKTFQANQQRASEFDCRNCGNIHAVRNCPAFNKTCSNCGRRNHFMKMCRQKKYREVNNACNQDDDQSSTDDDVFLGYLDEAQKRWEVPVQVGTTENLIFRVDTGADVCLINSKTYNQMREKPHLQA